MKHVAWGSVVLLGFGLAGFGMAQETGRIQGIRMLSEHLLEIHVTGPSDHVHTLQTSTNLQDWTLALERQASEISIDGSWTIQLDLGTDPLPLFYRAEFSAGVMNPPRLTALPGEAGNVANNLLPDLEMPAEVERETTLVADVLPVSLAHFLVILEDTTNVETFNDLLVDEGLVIVGSVPAMKVLQLRRNVVTTIGDLAGQMNRLRDMGIFTAVAPNLGIGLPVPVSEPAIGLRVGESNSVLDWTWDAPPPGTGTGGNNALELSRIPQAWNWLDYGFRQKAIHGGHRIAVMEFAFFRGHDDEPVNISYNSPPTSKVGPHHHGIGVLGVVGAARLNGAGVQGVTSLSDAIDAIRYSTNTTAVHSYEGPRLGQLASVLCREIAPKVINISAGVPWGTNDPATLLISGTETGAQWIDRLGDLWKSAFESLNSNCSAEYLVVCSAGNDNGVDARYNSPMANVACRQELNTVVRNFLPVENVRADGTTSPTSNVDRVDAGDTPGDIASAGGSGVTLLSGSSASNYRLRRSGTSYAAPLVTGLASYLWTLDPDLTVQELKQLLIGFQTSRTVPGGANLVDGFAAVLGIDKVQGNHKLQRALVDVDDGTLDGNLRLQGLSFEQSPDTVHTSDKRRGDGNVNMSDFRAFRDAYLIAIGVTNFLDGPTNHFKRDLNFDGIVDGQIVSPPHPAESITPKGINEAPAEDMLARFDFNGNGRIDPGNLLTTPGARDVSPFLVDPDNVCSGRDVAAGCLLDLDILLDPNIWEVTDENVVLTGAGFSPPFPGVNVPLFDWSPTGIAVTNFFGGVIPLEYVPHLWSCDVHLSMEETDPSAPNNIPHHSGVILGADGLWIVSASIFANNRGGEWEGVMTFPVYHPMWSPVGPLPPEAAGMLVQYKKTVGQEWRQYFLTLNPGPGEDVLLNLGFNKLDCSSTTRNKDPEFLPRVRQFEVLAKLPDVPPYSTKTISTADGAMVREIANQMAHDQLANRLRLPPLLDGGADIQAIYETESVGDTAIKIELFGITAEYE